MKVLVIGTSNSVLRGGWVDGLRNSVDGIVVNRSVGASCSAYLLYELCALSEETHMYDIVILDSMVNDEHFLDKGFLKEEYLLYYIREIYNLLAGKIVFYLSFSSKKFFNCESKAELYHRSLSFSHGAYFFSLKKIINKFLSDNKDIDSKLIYEDPGHIHRAIAYEIGKGLGKIINTAKLNETFGFSESSRFSIHRPYNPNIRSIIEETRLRKELLFEYPDKSRISLPPEKIVHGLFINARNTNCYIEFFTHDSTRNIVRGCFNNSGGRMQMKFIHFNCPFLPIQGHLRVINNGENHKSTEIFIHTRKSLESGNCLIQLAGILISDSVDITELLSDYSMLDTNDEFIWETKELEKNIDLKHVVLSEKINQIFPRSWIEL